MPWSITLPDAENPGSNVTYTDSNLEGLAYDDEPGGFRSIVASVAAAGQYANKATSPTSHNFTVSSKVFSNVVGAFGFAAGSAVRCANVAGTSYMDGIVTAIDLVAQTLTVNVLSVGAGSGSNSSWVITLGNSVSTIVSTPVAIASGGWGASTVAGGLTNFDLKHMYGISSVLSTPPGSPANGQRHIVGSSPTGAWVGHENALATFTTGVGWGFTTPGTGDGAYDAALGRVYAYTGGSQPVTGIYPGSFWIPMSVTRAKWEAGGSKTSSYVVQLTDHNKWFQAVASGGAIIFTLPAIAQEMQGMELVVEVEGGVGSTTFQISGGTNFRLSNGTEAASIVISGGTYARYRFLGGPSGALNGWYATPAAP